MSLEGYESPISFEIKELLEKRVDEIMEKREDFIVNTISEQIGIKIDKSRLIAALNFDKSQYQEAYENGYNSGYEDAQNDLLNDILPLFGLDISQFKGDGE